MGKVYERHRRIRQLLSGGRYRTAVEVHDLLAAEGETISERQVKRILNELRDNNYLHSRVRKFGEKPGKPPTEYAAHGKAPSLPIEQVKLHQALTLQLAAELLDPLLPASVLEPLKVELKVAKDLIRRDAPSLKRFPNKVAVLARSTARPHANENSTLATIYQALLEERRLDVGYSAGRFGKKPPRTHEISPLGLVCRFDTLYLVLVRETEDPKKDPNHVMEWPVHRFNRAELLDTPIRKPPGFNLKTHLTAPGFLQNNLDPRLKHLGESFKIELRFKETTGHYVLERPFGGQQAVQAPDGTFLVKATVANTRDLLSELFNFADDVEVLQPKALRDYLRERAEAVAVKYQDKPKLGPKQRRKTAAAPA